MLVALVLALGIAAAPADTARARLAPAGEPGDPLIVTGTVYESDGKTPASGVELIAYHTDRSGVYSKDGSSERARLKGRLVTGSSGAYELRTIVPGPYPGGGVPRHVHFMLAAKDGRRASTEVQFLDDPILPEADRERGRAAAAKGDRFCDVQQVARDASGVRRVRFDLRLPSR